ncbi:hypothetical protein [Thalassobacillus hwangdonensis]|uniref:Uncharacterized protein n=1 Tax=Thalassobacillus hwangdonensis TaxID=546108 RepID=A0ABW3L3P2_9BACI
MVEIIVLRPEKEIGMGCCGGLCGDRDGLINMENEFAHHDDSRLRLGEWYRSMTDLYGEKVDITFIDPRNTLAILMYFGIQVKRGNVTAWRALRHVLMDMKYDAIFMNGRLTSNEEREVFDG